MLLWLCVSIALATALDTSDPRDPVYQKLDFWAARGYVSRLPLLRPYPRQLLASLLEEVVERGDPESAREARALREQVTKEARFAAEVYHATSATQDAWYSATGGYLTTGGSVGGLFSVDGRMGGVMVAEPGAIDAFVPGELFPVDYIVDWSAVNAAGMTLLPTLSAWGSAAFGTDRLWFQIGLNRHGFGPFDEGPVLSPQAAQAGHFSSTWRGRRLTYTEFLLALTATRDLGDALGEDGDIGAYPNKYLTGHSFQFSPASWLDIGLFETIVYGERFEPLYLVPLVSRLYVSSYLGTVDNQMLGFSVSARLPSHFGFDMMFYADDLHFLDLLSLDLDTKYKVSGQAGLTWTPLQRILKRVAMDYALVTPYTYTHRRESIQGLEDSETPPAYYANGINYYNYSHAGRSLVALDPNSDRLRLRAMLRATERLDVDLSVIYQRHANATDSAYPAEWYVGTSDGGINDNGYDKVNGHRFETVEFLSQDVIEQILLIGASASWRTPLGRGTLSLEGGYTLEIARNKRGSDPNNTAPIEDNDVVLHHLSLGLRYAW